MYAYHLEPLYQNSIDKGTFSARDIENLFQWKNGMKLSGKKRKTLDGITHRLEIINGLKTNFDLGAFQNEFGKIAIIWKIFLLHIISPQRYPIFDQHVCRAFHFLQYSSLSGSLTEKIYFQDYVPFFDSVAKISSASRKRTDEALMMFGKFLKTEYGIEVSRLAKRGMPAGAMNR